MSSKSVKQKKSAAVLRGIMAGSLSQAVLSSVYAVSVMKGRGGDKAEIIMLCICAVSALMCGIICGLSDNGSRLKAMISGVGVSLITAAIVMLISTDGINTKNVLVVFAEYIVLSYIGALSGLCKSNKKIHKALKK